MLVELLSELGNKYRVESILTIQSEEANLKPYLTSNDFSLEVKLTGGVTILTDEVFNLVQNNANKSVIPIAVSIFKELKKRKYDVRLLAVFCEKENKFLLTVKVPGGEVMFRVEAGYTQVGIINVKEISKSNARVLIKLFRIVNKIHQIKDYDVFMTLFGRVVEKSVQESIYEPSYY